MYVLLGIVLIIFIVIIASKEKLTIPPFKYPSDIQQPLGPRGWGYRDPVATYQTLMWEQCQPIVQIPQPQYRQMTGYWHKNVDSAPVPKKCSPFDIPELRPPTVKIQQRPQAQSLYANWASTLQA